MNAHHRVFDNFRAYEGKVPAGYQVDFVGAFVRTGFVAGAGESTPEVKTQCPPVDEEYFEWIDVLESVLSARDQYVMFELGAGYGRWLVRAAAALRQRNPVRGHFVAVEAEPKHFQWLEQHFCDNGLTPRDHTLVQGVVSDKSGERLFYIGTPKGGDDRADQWYGQAIAHSYERVAEPDSDVYEGFKVLKLESGWKAIRVPCIALGHLLKMHNRVDLIDLDVQGEELKIIESEPEELSRKVARLHIGTHAHDIEEGLRKVFGRLGWGCLADFPCLSTSETPWGTVSFTDGVQSWINPRFIETCMHQVSRAPY
jgi:FkbM family methyltransferase